MSRNVTRAPVARYGWNDLEQVNSVIADARRRSESRQNIQVPSIADLNIQYVDPSPRAPKGGYVATIDGKTLPLGDGAIRTGCKLMKSKPDFFRQFTDPMAFAQTLRNVIDNPSRKQQGVLIRTGLGANNIDDEIAAILPPDYNIRDAHEQLTDFAGMLEDYAGQPVRGVSRLEQGHGDHVSYRMVLGDNIMPGLDDLRGQFMMFMYGGSETGMAPDQTTLGMYRLICTNGAMRLDNHQLVSEWNHKSGLDKYLSKTAETIRHLGYFGDTWGKVFAEANTKKLDVHALDLLHAVREEKLITSGHYDAAERLSVAAVDGPVETEFDFYNLLTRAAQDLPSISARQRGESSALQMFSQAGGVVEAVRKAGARRESGEVAPLVPDTID
jgi:hypothetical protein